MYIVKGEQQNGNGPKEHIFYWVQEVESENATWFILIVHDARGIRYFCCKKLESMGFHVVICFQ